MIPSEENSTVSIPAEFDDPEAIQNGDNADGIFDDTLAPRVWVTGTPN